MRALPAPAQICPYMDLTSPRRVCAAAGSVYFPSHGTPHQGPLDTLAWVPPWCCCQRSYMSHSSPGASLVCTSWWRLRACMVCPNPIHQRGSNGVLQLQCTWTRIRHRTQIRPSAVWSTGPTRLGRALVDEVVMVCSIIDVGSWGDYSSLRQRLCGGF